MVTALQALRGRALPLVGSLALCALAWVYLFAEASDMAAMRDATSMGGMAGMDGMAGMGAPWTLGEWAYLVVMWSIMMVAMMLPSALPTVLLVAGIDRKRRAASASERSSGSGITPLFVTGYLLAWTGYSIVAATVQWALHGTLLVSDAMVSASPVLSGGLLLAAGLFQFTPLKDRCISHCRSPLSFIMGHWRDGRAGALRMGLHHGSYCVGCCWALMALLFVLGVMNLIWVTALAVIVLLEKTLPSSAWASGGIGAVLLGWGLLTLLGPAAGLFGA
jgi:predicted metal-binding membrane protein